MIEVVGFEPIDDQLQWIYLLVSLEQKTYELTHVAPAHLTGGALDGYIQNREEFYRQEITFYLYPQATEIDREGNEVGVDIPIPASDEMLAWEKNRNLVPEALPNHPEIVPGSPQSRLHESDLSLVRVVEDIWNVIKYKGLVTDNDLPIATRNKLAARETLRAMLHSI